MTIQKQAKTYRYLTNDYYGNSTQWLVMILFQDLFTLLLYPAPNLPIYMIFACLLVCMPLPAVVNIQHDDYLCIGTYTCKPFSTQFYCLSYMCVIYAMLYIYCQLPICCLSVNILVYITTWLACLLARAAIPQS